MIQFFISYFLFFLAFDIFALQPIVEIPCKEVSFNCGILESEAQRFYKEQGEWSGIFTMLPIRSVHAGGNICHIRYNYSPVPNNGHRTDFGFDYRAFHFKLDTKTCQWKAYHMEGYLSGKLAK